ncbi:MAG: ribosome biogenesis GTP-binding protein YihA/YsxC [Eggerthellaceae bacterium]|jgi:GTP-binding protein|nr:ribosome biogenesis GTP-binding protein YihA/YsxC [Eggerthellaceae bacterium]
MDFSDVQYLASYGTPQQLPPSMQPEIVFAGRSNVGKSSLMNAVFGRKKLVKASATPGKTTTINVFGTKTAQFIDLPGYGYARVSESERERWRTLIEAYLVDDRSIVLTLVLLDIRRDPSDLDRSMVTSLIDRELPFALILTKADKISRQQQQQRIRTICSSFSHMQDVPVIVSSAAKGTGIDDVRALIGASLRH